MICVLTGPIGTGKTTALRHAFTTPDAPPALGVLQPLVDGQRHVLDVATGEARALEVSPTALPEAMLPEAIVRVGRFAFCAKTLAWARERLRAASHEASHGTWVLVDEIGPLELRGEGLAPALGSVLEAGRSRRGPSVLLVVRAASLRAVTQAFGLDDASVVRLGEPLPGGPLLARGASDQPTRE